MFNVLWLLTLISASHPFHLRVFQEKVLTLRRSIQLALRIKVSPRKRDRGSERAREQERKSERVEVLESVDAAFNRDSKFSRYIDSA